MSEQATEYTRAGGGDQDASHAADIERESGAAQDEAALLWPERSVTLTDGRQVVVDEMKWAQSMRLTEHWRPIADGLSEVIHGSVTDSGEPADVDIGQVTALFEEHGDAAATLLEECTSLSRDEVEALPLDDGQALLVNWLGVHLPFFGRRLRLAKQLVAGLRDGVDRAKMASARSAPSS